MLEQETSRLDDGDARSIGSILSTLPELAALRRGAKATINFVNFGVVQAAR